MDDAPVYIEMDEEIEDLLAAGGMSLQEILNSEGIDARVEYGAPPYREEEGAATRDVAAIIFASAAAVYLIGKTITGILKTTHQKPVYDVYYELKPLTDEKGEIIRDEKGKPMLVKQKTHWVYDPGAGSGEETSEVSAGLKGLVMKFTSKAGGSPGQ